MPAISIVNGRPSGDTSPRESFTQIPDSDLESIGRHCQFEYCRQLDFLPFRCESCGRTFCLDHRTEAAHQCPRAGEWARRRLGSNNATGTTVSSSSPQKPTIYNADQCAHVSCKTLINTLKDPGVRCPNCNRQYCLKHRLREEHECAKIATLGARPAASASPNDTLRSMFARVRTWGKDGKSQAGASTSTSTTSSLLGAAKLKHLRSPATPKPNSPAARVAELNALKKAAKGDSNVPPDKRLFLHVVGPAERGDLDKTEPPAGDFWFDSRWKVGRVLDDAARRLNIENLNNRVGGEEARLRIFHVESGDFLEFSEPIGAGKVKQAHSIVLLRGAGPLLGK